MDVSSVGGYDTTSSISDRQVFGAQVVTATLNTMNQNEHSFSNHNDSSYEFQTSVLNAYAGKGTLADYSV